jgi:hypothetical protein
MHLEYEINYFLIFILCSPPTHLLTSNRVCKNKFCDFNVVINTHHCYWLILYVQ